MVSARPCHMFNLLGLLNFQRSKAYSATAVRISGQGIDLAWPGNLEKSRKVVPQPRPPGPGTPRFQSASQEILWYFCDPFLTSVVSRGHLPQLNLPTSTQNPPWQAILIHSQYVPHPPKSPSMDNQLQQDCATFYPVTYSLKPAAVCRLHAENAAETDRMSDL
eukprot:351484-Chlamydomonas_euryale.AAC.5